MFQSLTDLFDALRGADPADAQVASDRSVQLAAAVLLVEVMKADRDALPVERRAAALALRNEFGLGDSAIETLLATADEASRNAVDYFAFTSCLNERFEMAERICIVEQLWRVAYADDHLSAEENHTLWRIADLLHIPQGAYIHAKLRARGDEGGG